jgi:hypothetical protein
VINVGAAMPPQQHWETDMKIKVIGQHEVWFDDKPQSAGYIGEVEDSIGEELIARGIAEKVATRSQKKADDE